ncbi:AcrR family transcriptional regulator [Catenulispora sp. MAP5-51]|uniref:TetR/AcrR family transcriptional regulator n=1 Tax=Catenulispora sp. MAP5-51 TaxID=3156298 RepID=UPI0035166515
MTADTADGASTRRLRADAERNRRVLLDTAARVLAEKGLDVPISYIAREAGLGQGTVFRRFPSKENLVLAVVMDQLGALVELGDTLSSDESDPAEALHRFLSAGIQVVAENRGVCEAVYGSMGAGPELPAVYRRIVEIMDDLVSRARSAGAVRADITAEDLVLLQRGVAQAAAPLREYDPQLWRRYLDLVWDALSPKAAGQLYGNAPTFAWGSTGVHTDTETE